MKVKKKEIELYKAYIKLLYSFMANLIELTKNQRHNIEVNKIQKIVLINLNKTCQICLSSLTNLKPY